MRVLILANGEPPSVELAGRLAAEHDLLIAADGAAQRALALGLRPDIICGDFDSVQMDVARSAFPAAEFVPTPDQDKGDLEKALLLALERGARRITIMGTAGGRIDHMLANHALLLCYHRELDLAIVEDGAQVRAISGRPGTPGVLTLATTPGDTVSLISFEATARVSITGVRWEVHDLDLLPGTRGISNMAEGEHVLVEVSAGTVLVCLLTRNSVTW
jgi:thiamine pyrophosphokinase